MRRRAPAALAVAIAAAGLVFALGTGGAGGQTVPAGSVLLPPPGDGMYFAANPDFGGGEADIRLAETAAGLSFGLEF